MEKKTKTTEELNKKKKKTEEEEEEKERNSYEKMKQRRRRIRWGRRIGRRRSHGGSSGCLKTRRSRGSLSGSHMYLVDLEVVFV